MNLRSDTAFNQCDELIDYNLFSTHAALVDGCRCHGAATAHDQLTALGDRLGRADMLSLGDTANRNPRRLVAEGLHTGPWAERRPGAHVVRAAGYLMRALFREPRTLEVLAELTRSWGAR